ncbi:MAG: MATE family efflux transporter [Corynebacterium sp.]|uniref:MATE family efflux transporter n=1 Tax=Corynebacterium sp. TaxID=1720 RepID=UPI0026DB9339|nr:MATE family efflux transporter [Corynebacterium sp.]MDO5029257.1 MATE family efflux transporter [Corynebacterium sp.]
MSDSAHTEIQQTHAPSDVSLRAIVSLALPALGVLAAPALYVLLDTAVIGRLGAIELAALAAGSTVFSVVTTQLTFLAYGTTARSARAFGRGNVDEAVAEGLQATWVAVFVGLTLCVIMLGFAPTFTGWLAPQSDVAHDAGQWLRTAAFAIPLVLIAQAGNGWLRGIQNTRAPLVYVLSGLIPAAIIIVPLVRAFGLVGSAMAILVGELITGGLFLRALLVECNSRHLPLRPNGSTIKSQLVLGRDLIVRSLSFQVAFLSAAGVAGRVGPTALGGHQVMLQLWNLISLVLDSLAIAAQTLAGAALGASSTKVARWTGKRVTLWSSIISLGLAAIFALGNVLIVRIFTDNQGVTDAITSGPWWILVAMIPIGGVVFALDGVLLGAGDAAYLRNATVIAVLAGFLPPVWLAQAFGWGLVGIWCGLLLFMILRLVFVATRFSGEKWYGVTA